MVDGQAALVAVIVLVVCLGLRLLALAVSAIWRSEIVQGQVLRLTGESAYLPTSWSSRRPTQRTPS